LETRIRAILTERIDVQRQSVGMVVGCVTPKGSTVVARGLFDRADPRPVDADTVFRIGSITKVFTGLLLADAVRRGEVRLDDPLAMHLPEGATVPQRGGRAITLVDLATHTSGLPMLPTDFPMEGDLAGRARYTRADLMAFLAGHQLTRDVGAEWAYSNLGMALLALALMHRTGLGYEALVKARITGPLGTPSTGPEPDRARLSPGHGSDLAVIADDPHPAMPGAGDLCSTASDLMRLVGAFMGQVRTPLAEAMASMLAVRRPMPAFHGEQAIGLQVWGSGDRQIVGHDGSKPGFASSMLWTPGRLGVVVLSNAAPPVGDISRHLLDPGQALAAPVKAAVSAPAALTRFLGRYREAKTGTIFEFTRSGDALAFEALGQAPKVALVAEGPDAFNMPRLGLTVRFEGPAERAADSVEVTFGAMVYRAQRVP
jgi:CubicO group peptidase (beta-lactamase class C family)